jgi:ribose transport system substrate-binding protein
MGAKRLVEKLKGKGNVVFFTLAGQPNVEERLKGFKAYLEAYPNIKIVDAINIQSNATLAFDQTEEILALTGPKRIDAFVSLESASGVEVASALDRSHVTDRIAMAWDNNPDTLNGIKNGTIDATVAQKPFTMGFVGLKALDEVFHNPPLHLDKNFTADAFSPYPEFVDTGTALVDKSNVSMYFPQGK